MIGLALLIGTPLGIAAGTYLAEHGRYTRLAVIVSFVNDILLSAPSIIIGLFVYEIMVRTERATFRATPAPRIGPDPPADRRSDDRGIAAAGARPDAGGRLRPRPAAVAGDTPHPLQGRAQRDPHRHSARRCADCGRDRAAAVHRAQQSVLELSLSGPLANVPVVIFQYAMSPYDEWHELAWAGAFVLTAFVLLLNISCGSWRAKAKQ